MPKAGDIKYCDILGGRKTNAAFVYVPPSALVMGDYYSANLRIAGVSRGFWLQQTPLTDEQYQFLTYKNTSGSPGSKEPKQSINWNYVNNLISNKPFRMPTEAEWEMAAKAGVGRKYGCAGSNICNNVAWTSVNSWQMAAKGQKPLVAKLKSNSFGFFDMTGNVEECCLDYYSYIREPQINPRGPASGTSRVYRGGSWELGNGQGAVDVSSSYPPDYRYHQLGVRLVWEI